MKIFKENFWGVGGCPGNPPTPQTPTFPSRKNPSGTCEKAVIYQAGLPQSPKTLQKRLLTPARGRLKGRFWDICGKKNISSPSGFSTRRTSHFRMNIATFQKQVSKASFESVVSTLTEDLHNCDSQAIDIACFPECHLTGYRLEKEDIEQNALSLDSDQFRFCLQAWSNFKVTFILGLIEKTNKGYFNSAAVISQGKVLGCYRKTHPNEENLLAGEDYPVFSNGTIFGINICNDANYPDAAHRLARQGAKVLFYPLNNLLWKDVADKWRTKSQENLQLRAQETGCWVISADVAGFDGKKMSYGCTQIVSPMGKVIAFVPELEQGYATASIPV